MNKEDDSSQGLKRRLLLKTVGVSATVGIAGCQGLGDEDDASGDDTHDDDDASEDVPTTSEEQSLTIVTQDAEDVDVATALLIGELRDAENISTVEVAFEYGHSGDLNQFIDAGATDREGEFETVVDDLTPGTEYQFRAVGETQSEEEYGDILEFVTGERINIVTVADAEVDGTSATIFGELDSIEASTPATVKFEYWETGSENKHDIEAAELETTGSFNVEVADLFGATEYSFRAVGETAQASDVGETRTFATPTAWQPRSAPDSVPIEDIIGASHVGSGYNFTDKPLLEEGAERLNDLGANVIKLWDHQLPDKYPFNHDWNAPFDSMRDALQSEYFQTVFKMDFSTYVLLAHSRTFSPEAWVPVYNGVSDGELKEVERRFQDVSEYLLQTYDGTGKIFVFQPWELDNHALSPVRDEDPDGWRETELSEEVAEHYRRWLRARQNGVKQARDRIESDVSVLNAAEVNFVLDAKNEGTSRVINTVVPETDVDLVSYSAHELEGQLVGHGWAPGHNAEEEFDRADEIITETLDYIEQNAPEPNDYVNGILSEDQSNVYLGEYGTPLNEEFPGEEAAMRAIRTTTEHSLEWGVRWALYWQVYDNEPTIEGEITDNDDVRGFHLIRPDGSKAPTWDYYQDLLESGDGD